MKRRTLFGVVCLLAVALMGVANVSAAEKKKAEPATTLTAAGEKLLARYSEMLTALQAEIAKAVPAVDEQKKSAYLKTREAEKAAEAEVTTKQAALDAAKGTLGMLEHRKGWVSRAAVAVSAAEEKVKQATAAMNGGNKEEAAKALKAAQEALDKEQKNATLGANELKKSQEAVDKAKLEEPKLTQATPRGLAEFAQKGKEQEALVEKLLADNGLMKQMLVADGAKEGKYGRAMEIHMAIQKASPKAGEGLFQRLALGTSLAHAAPIAQSNPKAQTDAPATVDPVKRYQHYEKAFLDGELDPGFKDLTVWEYRNAVNGNEPDSILAWGREMLRNYRPDEISTSDISASAVLQTSNRRDS